MSHHQRHSVRDKAIGRFIYRKTHFKVWAMSECENSTKVWGCLFYVCGRAQSCVTIGNPMNCSPQNLSMGFSRQKYWSGLPFPSPEDLPDSRIKPTSLVCPTLAGRIFTTLPPGKPVSFHQIRSDQISRSVVSDSATPWIAARQASLSITNSRSSLRLTSIETVMPSSHLILCRPLLLPPPIPPSIRVFLMSQLFAWGGQSTGVSASVSFLPKKSQGWSPSEWTGWISLQSKGLWVLIWYLNMCSINTLLDDSICLFRFILGFL